MRMEVRGHSGLGRQPACVNLTGTLKDFVGLLMVASGVLLSSRIPREASFSSASLMQDAQDYDNDAIVVHMGCFEVPAWSFSDDGSHGRSSPVQSQNIELVINHNKTCSVTPLESGSPSKERQPSPFLNAVGKEQLQLYSVAAPGMRKPPDNMEELVHYKGWCEPVNARPGWVQVQKGFFDAPGGLWR